MITREKARKLRAVIERGVTALDLKPGEALEPPASAGSHGTYEPFPATLTNTAVSEYPAGTPSTVTLYISLTLLCDRAVVNILSGGGGEE